MNAFENTQGVTRSEEQRRADVAHSIELGVGERGRAGFARLELMLTDVLERMTAVDTPQSRPS